MGRFRYAVLVTGKGSADGRNVLLEFKESRPSAYDLYRNRENDAKAFATRAAKEIAVERESQAASSPTWDMRSMAACRFRCEKSARPTRGSTSRL